MIAGATYKNGLAIAPNGAVYVSGIASGSLVPSTGIASGGAMIPGGMKVSLDGHLYVRYR